MCHSDEQPVPEECFASDGSAWPGRTGIWARACRTPSAPAPPASCAVEDKDKKTTRKSHTRENYTLWNSLKLVNDVEFYSLL